MYGDSTALSSDSSPIFSPNSKPKEEGFMDSSMNHFEYKQFQNNPINPGLLRFRSAPSSLLLNFVNGVDKGGDSNEGSLDHRALSPENQGLNPRFNSTSFEDLEDNKDLGNGYSLNSQFSSQFPIQCSNSMTVEHQGKMASNLTRQSSSPAGFFSHLNSQSGYATMRGVGNYRLGNGANGDLSRSSSQLKAQMNFSSGVPSTLGMLTRISEIEGENVGASDSDDTKLGDGNGDTQFYSSEYPFGSWNDSLHFSENFPSLKRELDDDGKLFSGAQNMELGNRTPILSHHLSLRNMGAMEKLLRFQDSVPCKIRAKRGCATHPRSIAERVRRTRISERMRKLQELVPNMDKQTNTADMLDLAVEYIKELQKQFKTLSDHRANCKCSGMLKPIPH